MYPLPIDGLYIHIPYCTALCSYCDFVKFTPDTLLSVYPKLLQTELSLILSTGKIALTPKTLYIGGGTPSLQSGALLDSVMDHIAPLVPLPNIEEFTVEINPQDTSPALTRVLSRWRVSRISLGLQSLFSSLMANLGRPFLQRELGTWSEFLNQFSNPYNVDIMFGIPGQTKSMLIHTLKTIFALHPHHLSTYELTLPPHHPSYPYIPSEHNRLIEYNTISKLASDAGFHRYEVSNFSKPAHASKHNTLYWNFKNILGIGVSAHSSLNKPFPSENTWKNQHWTNPKTFRTYHNMLLSGKPPIMSKPFATKQETKELFIIAQLRKTEGLSLLRYQELFQSAFVVEYHTTLTDLIRTGHMEITPLFCRATSMGLLALDQLLKQLLYPP